MRSAFVLASLLATTAHAAIAEDQPSDPAHPQHRSYAYGSDERPYRLTYLAGSWLSPTDDVLIFEPVPGREVPTSAPVVVLLQGFVADGAWQFDHLVRHLTRSGMTVVYPSYLNLMVNGVLFGDWLDRSTWAIVDALAELESGDHLPVERDQQGLKLAFVAHSIGSYVASFLAERAATWKIFPAPRALVFLDPAGHDFTRALGIDTSQLGHIAADTDVVLLSAGDAMFDEAGAVDDNTQLAVADLTAHLPVDCAHMSAWIVPSDHEGDVRLVSDHYDGPQTHRVLDAVDWWGYWPQLSAHLKYAFWGSYADFRHAGGLHAGRWLDDAGQPIRPIAPRTPHPRSACLAP